MLKSQRQQTQSYDPWSFSTLLEDSNQRSQSNSRWSQVGNAERIEMMSTRSLEEDTEQPMMFSDAASSMSIGTLLGDSGTTSDPFASAPSQQPGPPTTMYDPNTDSGRDQLQAFGSPYSFADLKNDGNPMRNAEYNTMEDYLAQDVDTDFLSSYGRSQGKGYEFLNDEKMGSVYQERKQELYSTSVDVIAAQCPDLDAADVENRAALMVAMAMQEDAGGADNFEGWDTYKDKNHYYDDGSINYSIFNMNRDFLNSVRQDLHNPEVNTQGLVDPLGDEVIEWGQAEEAYFNQDGGWANLDQSVAYANAAIELWGADNFMNIHRSGYQGGKDPSASETRVYLEGMRNQTQFLIDNPEYLTNDTRVAGSIPHI